MATTPIDLTPLLRELAAMLARTTNRATLDNVGEILVSSVQLNFLERGRYGDKEGEGGTKRWKDVSPLYAAKKKAAGKDPKNILLYTGQLRSSITYRTEGSSVYVGTNKNYAEDLQRGKGKMPPRPFLVIQSEDVDDIQDVLVDSIIGG